MLVAERPVTVSPTIVVNCGHSAGKTAFGRHLPDHVLTVPRPSPKVGKAEEVETGPICLRMARALCSLWTEVNEARLVGMEGESKACQTLAQDRQHEFGVDDVVERHQRVIVVPDEGADWSAEAQAAAGTRLMSWRERFAQIIKLTWVARSMTSLWRAVVASSP
jgi:hypothetical protein